MPSGLPKAINRQCHTHCDLKFSYNTAVMTRQSNTLNHLIFLLKYALFGLFIGLLYLFFTGQLTLNRTQPQQPALVFSYAPAIDKNQPLGGQHLHPKQ